ncbi:aldehyde dehydrogenase family protein [Cryobacterium sp. N19]|uniref:aldehyde dehydrogenase family protein n=1 Tax=Cryobacterium sp. N19 TaxID=2048288 RepID=UPI001304CA5C|nr:aldehyde dehydrogenase family protein [Cryobacterium sp. N19]
MITKTFQKLYIGGEWVSARGDGAETVHDRWTGDELADVATATAEDAHSAVDAAVQAFESGLPVHKRVKILHAVAALVATSSEVFALSISRETGKPITAARTEVDRAVGTLTYAAEEAARLPGETVPIDATSSGEGMIAFTIPEARGVVAAITPFNFPLNLVIHKVGPALAAGCPVVLKPSDKAPIVAGMLVQAFHDAGLPAGWLNLVTGPPELIVAEWQRDDRVRVLTFTGSARIGWALKSASPHKLHILELGSNAAMYVDKDADVDRAVADSVAGGYSNSGQACVSLQRIFVHKTVADDFSSKLAAAVKELPAGDPTLPETVVGPLITAQAADRVSTWIAQAVAEGATVLAGGTEMNGVIAPTVMTAVQSDSPLLCQEVFGPVVTIVHVESAEEAIERINESVYGLNTSIYTSDLAAAFSFSRRIQSGTVLVNIPPSFRADHMPYGGVKESGQGREGVKYAVAEMLLEKLVIIRA